MRWHASNERYIERPHRFSRWKGWNATGHHGELCGRLDLLSTRPLLSGWLILYRGGGSEAKKKFVYLKLTSKFGPL